MKLQINITKEILRESMFCKTPNECVMEGILFSNAKIGQNCAIGKAIFRLFGNLSWVGVYQIRMFERGVTFTDSGETVNEGDITIPLPGEAVKFIAEFDTLTPGQRLKMTELSFVIDVPDSVIELIGIEEAYKAISESKSLELV